MGSILYCRDNLKCLPRFRGIVIISIAVRIFIIINKNRLYGKRGRPEKNSLLHELLPLTWSFRMRKKVRFHHQEQFHLKNPPRTLSKTSRCRLTKHC